MCQCQGQGCIACINQQGNYFGVNRNTNSQRLGGSYLQQQAAYCNANANAQQQIGQSGMTAQGLGMPKYQMEEYFFTMIDGKSDIEIVEQIMKHNIRAHPDGAFYALCQRFRPTITPAFVEKIKKLKVFL